MGRTVWFPGHMAKGRRELEEIVPLVDLVIEVRDARAPLSTAAPFAEDLTGKRTRWIVLSHKDLADPKCTDLWLAHFKRLGVSAVALNLRGNIASLRASLLRHKPSFRELRLAVIGIPNVGKSTLLNALVRRKKAEVGLLPGVTRRVSWYRGEGFLVLDSPGILDPSSDPFTHQLLAWLGCSKVEVIGGYEVLALSLLRFLKEKNLIGAIRKKWGVDMANGEQEALEAVGRRLGCLGPGGEVDLERAGMSLLKAFSGGDLGRFTLEMPEESKDEVSGRRR